VAIDFLNRRDGQRFGDRLPPSQKVVEEWPVLTYGVTPQVDLNAWTLRIFGAVEEEVAFTWSEFMVLPQVKVRADFHCVTGWSKLDNEWEGIPLRELMKHIRPKRQASAVMAHSHGGYATNILLEDLLRDNALLAQKHNGRELTAEHGGPLRLVVPHLYAWKSAKWLRSLEFLERDQPGFWEMYGYHTRGDPFKEERYS
jgi:DMSO/TMAO reductase YedYZ molybdopterin-dependent catalytic subunit